MNDTLTDSLTSLVMAIGGASVFGDRWPWLAVALITTTAGLVIINAIRTQRAN